MPVAAFNHFTNVGLLLNQLENQAEEGYHLPFTTINLYDAANLLHHKNSARDFLYGNKEL